MTQIWTTKSAQSAGNLAVYYCSSDSTGAKLNRKSSRLGKVGIWLKVEVDPARINETASAYPTLTIDNGLRPDALPARNRFPLRISCLELAIADEPHAEPPATPGPQTVLTL